MAKRTKRSENDFYETKPWVTRELLDRVPALGAGQDVHIFEPCVGDGAIANVLRERFPRVTTADISTARPADFYGDARTAEYYESARELRGPVDWVVTNPPFSVAFAIARRAVEETEIGVALLLRLSFLEPTFSRSAWLAAYPPVRELVTPRIPFRRTERSTTDSVTTAWFLWPSKRLTGYIDFGAPPIVIIAKVRELDGQRPLIEVPV